MIIFENRGEIDIDAITTFGVSVKEGPNPIGFFGTGLKYAIAVLLRSGHKVSIWTGDHELRFTTERREVRNKPFEFVLMREGDRLTSLGFTTELGKTWKPWMAYRELYCNARDEGGSVYRTITASSATDPARGLTQIRVEGDDIEAVHRDADQYFCEDEPDVVCNGVGIYRRPSQVLFYRGVRVLFLPKAATFTYNFIDRQIDLTEDRTMTHPFMATYYLAEALAKCEDPAILEAALAPARDSLEWSFDYQGHGPTQVFIDAVGKLKSAGRADVAKSAADVWRVAVPEQFIPRPSNLMPGDLAELAMAIMTTKRIGFDPGNVIVVDETPGCATTHFQDDTLYLLRECVRPDAGDSGPGAELVGNLIHGCIDRDGLAVSDLVERMVKRLLS